MNQAKTTPAEAEQKSFAFAPSAGDASELSRSIFGFKEKEKEEEVEVEDVITEVPSRSSKTETSISVLYRKKPKRIWRRKINQKMSVSGVGERVYLK